jgi:hypothetical protein
VSGWIALWRDSQAAPLPSIRVRGFVRARDQECGCAMKVKALVFPGKFLGSGVYGDAFQDFADFGCQGFQVEGLLHEIHAALQDAVAEDAIVGVTGDIEDL